MAASENPCKQETYIFAELPETADQMHALLQADPCSDFRAAALSVLALCQFESSPQDCFAMLDVLKGPQALTPYEKSFLQDRLQGKGYKPRSFFAGATPQNGYAPTSPYSITVSANPYSYDEQGYATLYLKSGGADSVRPVKLRKKPSTGEWFLWEILYLSDIKDPVSGDPWA